jgi:uncharacterized protein YjbI with pentapeptide repeats
MRQLFQLSTRRRRITLVLVAIVLSAIALGGIIIVALRFGGVAAGALITAWATIVGVLITQYVNASLTVAQQERESLAEADRRERELEVENQRAQGEALQGYVDRIEQLLLDKDRPLLRSAVRSEVRILARARTLNVLPRLNGERKRSVLQFLYESGLVSKGRVVIDLAGADLREAALSLANLSGAYLSTANLSKASLDAADLREAGLSATNLSDASLSATNLHEADLSTANLSKAYLHATTMSRANVSMANLGAAYLSKANLRDADLRDADLTYADLSAVHLRWANLRDADLRRTDLSGADLRDADLSGADLRDANSGRAYLSVVHLRRADLSDADLRDADLRDADLREAFLRGADLSRANLREVDLRKADLTAANLSAANLSRTDLRDANLSLANLSGTYLSDTDLRAANLSLAKLSGANLRDADLRDAALTNATMPNGQNYEEWLETTEGQQWLETYKGGRRDDREIGMPDTPINIAYPTADDLDLRIDVGACRLEARPSSPPHWVAGICHDPTCERAPRVLREGGSVQIIEAKPSWERIPADFRGVPRYELEFDKERPFALTIETWLSEFDLDLGGVPVKSLTVRQGAGRFNLNFSAPNPQPMSLLEVSSGAAGIALENLANANFSRMRLSGAAAAYEFDFGGRLSQPAEVVIEAALGGVEIAVPGSTAAMILAETTVGTVHAGDGFTRREGAFLTEAAMTGKKPLLTIRAAARLGALQIRAT